MDLSQQVSHLLLMGQFRRAKQLAGEAIAGDPDNPELLYFLSVALCEVDGLDEALPIAERAVALCPQEARFLTFLGYCYAASDKFDAGYVAFSAAERADPSDGASFSLHVDALLRDPRVLNSHRIVFLAKARFLVDHLLRTDPAVPHTYLSQGKLFLAEHSWTQASDAARNALSIDPENPIAHQILGLALQELGQVTDAGDAFLRAGQASPDGSSRNLLRQLGRTAPSPAGALLGGVFVVVIILETESLGEALSTLGFFLAASVWIWWWRARHRVSPKVRYQRLSPTARRASKLDRKLRRRRFLRRSN